MKLKRFVSIIFAASAIFVLADWPGYALTIPQEAKPPTQEQKPAINLQDYVGRYQADPSMVENFILDVFVEKDQLWIKPSHSPKSQ